MEKINNINTLPYDHISERVVFKETDATVQDREEKFNKIVEALELQGIELVDFKDKIVYLEDNSCDFKMEQTIAAWEIFRIVDVVDMVIKERNRVIYPEVKNFIPPVQPFNQPIEIH